MQSNRSFIERENDNILEIDQDKCRLCRFNCRRILQDRKTPAFVIFIIFATFVPILIYYLLLDQSNIIQKEQHFSCFFDPPYRISCGKSNTTKDECNDINCCYDKSSGCFHSIPSKYNYRATSNCNSGLDCNFKSIQSETPLKNNSLPELKLTYVETDANNIEIILHTPELNYVSSRIPIKNYRVDLHDEYLAIEVFRAKTEERLLTTFRGPVIASDGYWEWSVQLTNKELFGFGELLLETNKTITKTIYKSKIDHNTVPNFMAHLNGSFHGVLIEHDGPLEVSVLPSRLIILRSLAGNRVVLKLSLGPTPKDVVLQQRSFQTPKVPYWVLGAHICRDGKTTLDEAIAEYKSFSANNNKIRFASECIHENFYGMLQGGFDEQHDIENLITSVKENSHFLMSFPPQILKRNEGLYNKSVDMGVLYKDKIGNVVIGSYLGEDVAYPDFTHPLIHDWMKEVNLNLVVYQADGFVLRDNWPVHETYVFLNENTSFPYFTKSMNSSLSYTLPWYASNDNKTENQHVFKHNTYGASQVDAVKKNLKFDFIMTSSYTSGLQEAALVQNVNASWTNLKKAIRTTLYHGMFGSSLISIPICGSNDEYDEEFDEELCMRWYLVAATLPLFRISSDLPRRDPLSLATGFAQDTALKAIERRYMLLPYYYSTLRGGEPLTRPMFYDFYADNYTMGLDEQYMVGNALLVAQPLLPDTIKLRIYLPPSVGVWYEFWGGQGYNGTGWINIDVVEDDWVMFIAEGHIIPMRNHKFRDIIGSTSSEDTFSLGAALNCSSKGCVSKGFLHLDTATLKFQLNQTYLIVSNIIEFKKDLDCNLTDHLWPHVIENVNIYGVDNTVNVKTVNLNLCTTTSDEFTFNI